MSVKQKRYFSAVKYRDPADPVVAAYADPKLDFIRNHVPLNGRILDVGCGNGVFTGRLAREGGDVVGLDFSRHLLDENRHASLVCGDIATLPIRDATFDVVFEANVLHHIDDRLAVVREMTRVSRRYVVLLEPNRYNPLMLGFSLVVPAERGGPQIVVAEAAGGTAPGGRACDGVHRDGHDLAEQHTSRACSPAATVRSPDRLGRVSRHGCGDLAGLMSLRLKVSSSEPTNMSNVKRPMSNVRRTCQTTN